MRSAPLRLFFLLLLIAFSKPVIAQEAEGLSSVARERLARFRAELSAAEKSSDPASLESCLRAALEAEEIELKRAAAREIGRRGLAARALHGDLLEHCDSSDPMLRIAAEQAYAKTVGLEARPTKALIAVVCLTVFTLIFGVLAALLPKGRGLEAVLLLGFVGIMIKALFTLWPALLLYGDGVPGFFYLERSILYPFAIPFLIAATRLMPEAERKRNGRAMGLFTAVLTGVFIFGTSWVYGTPECYKTSEGNWAGDVLLQSTSYTCGAASIVTLSRKLGRPDITEQEAAYWSHTLPNGGVDDLGAAAALRQIFPNKEVVIRRDVSLEELRGLTLPCLAAIKFSFFFDHMVTVLEAKADGFVIGDPLGGRRFYSDAELSERWLNAVVLVR